MNGKAGIGYWILIIIGTMLALMMLIGQTGALIDYDFTVSIGMQESEEELTPVGVVWAKGFAAGDTVFYIPLLISGLIGVLRGRKWGLPVMFGALAITAYWPVAWLYVFNAGKGLINLTPEKRAEISILIISISLYGLWGMWYLFRNQINIFK